MSISEASALAGELVHEWGGGFGFGVITADIADPKIICQK
jgi:hypothetical protein